MENKKIENEQHIRKLMNESIMSALEYMWNELKYDINMISKIVNWDYLLSDCLYEPDRYPEEDPMESRERTWIMDWLIKHDINISGDILIDALSDDDIERRPGLKDLGEFIELCIKYGKHKELFQKTKKLTSIEVQRNIYELFDKYRHKDMLNNYYCDEYPDSLFSSAELDRWFPEVRNEVHNTIVSITPIEQDKILEDMYRLFENKDIYLDSEDKAMLINAWEIIVKK